MSAKKTIVFITGASSGIGKSCAEYLSSKGYTVYGSSRSPEKMKELELNFNPVKMDADDENSVNLVVQFILDKEGRIDVVVNNAGQAIMGAIEDTSVEEAKMIFETNVFGIHRVCRAVLPAMRKQKAGRIINIGSIGGLMGLPFRGFYCASKFAVEGFSESLRMEAAPYGIKVSLIEPGDIRTSINENRLVAKDSGNGSVYQEQFTAIQELINEGVSKGSDPIVIAKAVEKIIRHPSPGVRYAVGFAMQKMAIAAKRILPATVFERIIKSHYNMK